MKLDTNTVQSPIVSVIVPVYNCAPYIEETIRSVMRQTFENWIMIVIDDGSTDTTCDIVMRLIQEDDRIQLVRNPENMGTAKTRNRGLELCTGDYVAFLDGDDIWHAEKLETQIKKIREENAGLVYTSYAIVNGEGHSVRKNYVVPAYTTFSDLLKENVIGCSTVLLTRETAKNHRFISDFYHEDYCLWLEMLKNGYKAVGCTEVLVDWRLITNSRSFNKQNSAAKRWRIYREYLHYPRLKSVGLFLRYMINGIRKYY